MIDTTSLHSTQTERNVIEACLMDTAIFDYVRDSLNETLFTDYDCRKAYEVMTQMDEDGLKPDINEVDTRLKREKVDIRNFFTGDNTSFELTRQRVEYLQDLSVRRRLSALFFKGETMVTDPMITLDDVRRLMTEFGDTIEDNDGSDVQPFGEVVEGLLQNVAARKEDKGESGLMTGLRIFDSRFGWHGGDLVIIGGETSMGKSTLATTIAYNMAMAGIPIAYYSLEMSSEQLAARIIARQVQVSSSTTLYGKVSDAEYGRLYDGSLRLRDLPIYFDEKSKTTFGRMRGSYRRLVKRHGVKVIFVDYLQILANGQGENREALIGDIAREMKRDATELDAVIVALSQMSRDKNAARPTLSRMRGSGQIEEACDMGVIIHRPNRGNNTAKIYLDKGRNCGVGEMSIRFDGALSYFSDYEDGDPDAPYEGQKEKLPF